MPSSQNMASYCKVNMCYIVLHWGREAGSWEFVLFFKLHRLVGYLCLRPLRTHLH